MPMAGIQQRSARLKSDRSLENCHITWNEQCISTRLEEMLLDPLYAWHSGFSLVNREGNYGGPLPWGLDAELKTHHCKNKWHVLKCYKKLQERAQVRFPCRKKGRMAKGVTEPTDYFIFSHEEGNDNHQSRHNFKKNMKKSHKQRRE